MTGADDAPCALLAWDSAFWGFPVARVTTPTLTEPRARDVDRWCVEHGVHCVFLLADAADEETLRVAEASGFAVVDRRITSRREARGERASDPRIRPAREADREAVVAITRTSYTTSRFYHDGRFDPVRCGELYARWIESVLDGDADRVLVAEEEGRCAGYATVELDEARALGRVTLLAIDAQYRRRGLGSALFDGALALLERRGARTLEIVTQARNEAAMLVYEAAGFRVVRAEVWLHKWYV